jgi:asparagine synthase (glutamine-hydrolysing)
MGYKLHKLADGIRANSLIDVYRGLISYWNDPAKLVLSSTEPSSFFGQDFMLEPGADFLDQMFYWDQIAYLPDDNLTKMDRASMRVGLESRAPLLDHRVVEFSWQLDKKLKIRKNQSKWLLRQVLYKYVPKHLIERPKMGFSVPIGVWLRGPLRDWGEHLLNESTLRSQGFLDSKLVRNAWHDHLSGRIEGQNGLWAVLMFQAWYEAYEK